MVKQGGYDEPQRPGDRPGEPIAPVDRRCPRIHGGRQWRLAACDECRQEGTHRGPDQMIGPARIPAGLRRQRTQAPEHPGTAHHTAASENQADPHALAWTSGG